MEQDYYVSSENKEEKVLSNADERVISKVKKKLDPHIAIIALQGGICLAVLIACLVIKTFFGGFFSELKTWYDDNMNIDTDVKQVLEGTSANGSGGPLETSADTVDLSEGFIMPVSGTLTSSYGYRADPFTGETAAHNGLDIAAESGTPIKAALSGTVTVADYSNGDYGNYIIIDHGGFKTLYGHCDTLCADVGDTVYAGEQIATCGSTGRSTGPHLHFEIRIGDTRIDPTPFLSTENQ